jgi:hypothetical protein
VSILLILIGEGLIFAGYGVLGVGVEALNIVAVAVIVVAGSTVGAGCASTAGVALRLGAGLGLEAVAGSTVGAGCASTAGAALQNNNAQTTNTTAATITTLSFAYIPPNLER